MNLDHDFFQVSKLSEDRKKKRYSPKIQEFFSGILWRPNIIQRSDVDHNQIIGGVAVKLLGEIYPPGFRQPCLRVTMDVNKFKPKI